MFCDEHGTADYCGECMAELMQKTIDHQTATIAELRGALEKIADLRNRAIGWEFAADIADAALLEGKGDE